MCHTTQSEVQVKRADRVVYIVMHLCSTSSEQNGGKKWVRIGLMDWTR